MGFNASLRTLRLSTNGGRTYQSMLANSIGGAGSVRRIYGYSRKYTPQYNPYQFYLNYIVQ